KGHLGQIDAKDANRPVRPKRETFKHWDILAAGTRGMRIAEKAESQSDCGHVSSADKGQGSPFRADRRFLSQTALGHPGQKDAKGAKEPAGPRTNQIMT
ncbi:hypothetical protein KI387_027451, partial [Taxus chinensis]